MKVEYSPEFRDCVALAVLALHEAGLFVSDILFTRVWFTFDQKRGNICIQCFKNGWVITWNFCGSGLKAKTYEELLALLIREKEKFTGIKA